MAESEVQKIVKRFVERKQNFFSPWSMRAHNKQYARLFLKITVCETSSLSHTESFFVLSSSTPRAEHPREGQGNYGTLFRQVTWCKHKRGTLKPRAERTDYTETWWRIATHSRTRYYSRIELRQEVFERKNPRVRPKFKENKNISPFISNGFGVRANGKVLWFSNQQMPRRKYSF